MGGYVKKSMLTIIRAFLMYRPLTFFSACALIPFTVGMVYVIRFLIFF